MVQELNDDTYSDLIASTDKALFIDFYSPTCGPCQSVLGMLAPIAAHFGDTALVCKVDVSRNPRLAQKYEIRSVPFCVSIGTDKMVKDYELGAASIGRYIAMIEKAQGKGFWSRLFGN
ncbi:MAG: thiol reductase thioredoxin [Campylobacterales bacterium]|nr:thiol reductase thioredoxin [Campylobacterales bacterium]